MKRLIAAIGIALGSLGAISATSHAAAGAAASPGEQDEGRH
jgi:hypothetical protein